MNKLRIPHAAIWLLLPIEGIGVLVVLAYVTWHFQAFVANATNIFNWCVWAMGAALYTGFALVLIYCSLKAFRHFAETITAFTHAIADIRQKWIATDALKARIDVLAERDNYIAYRQNGRITVCPVLPGPSGRGGKVEVIESEPGTGQLLPAPILSFAELLRIGTIQAALAEGKMLLGYTADDGMPRFGSWMDLYSCAIGGVSGSGKSTTVRFLLFQAVLAGAKLVMVDPHIEEKNESLAAQFTNLRKDVHVFPPTDENEKQVLKRVRWLMKEYQRRKHQGKDYPIIFVLDELNEIVRTASDELKQELSNLLLTIAQGGRKYGLFAMLIGQRWSEQDLGGKNFGAAIRTSLSAQLAHRFSDEEQAKKLIGGKHGPKCLELQQGHYYFRDTQGHLAEMITPDTVESDGIVIQRLLDAESTVETSYESSESSQKAERNQYAELPAGGQPLLPESTENSTKTVKNTDELGENTEVIAKMMRVLEMQADGKQKADIIKAIWGVSPGASPAYVRANNEYQQVLKLAYERLA
jgi:hypothetical protein